VAIIRRASPTGTPADGQVGELSGQPARAAARPYEPAGEVVEVGAEVTGLKVGDRVVVNPQGVPSGIIGGGGEQGAMSEYLLLENAELGTTVALVPDTVPFDLASLNEPMAVARHCVNRSEAKPDDKVVVFGGPSALGSRSG
jgi:(R,R)-butanediol dehydrogenase / meso-butanediol dehydrogenase / diacetyl reductase